MSYSKYMSTTNTTMKHEGYTITASNGLTTWTRDYKMAKMYVAANAGAKITKRMIEVEVKQPKVVHVLLMADGSEVELTKANVAKALRGE
jgi:hypothetical protein